MLQITYILVLFLSNVFGNEHFCFKTITTDLINAGDSYFGYSVQLRFDPNGNGRVIVGTPKASSIYKEHEGIKDFGAVYLCNIDDSDCKQYLLDNEGNTRKIISHGLHYMHNKNESWLGAVIDGDDSLHGILVACAPKWINQFYADKKFGNKPYLQSGLCYILEDAGNVNELATISIPLQNTNLTYDLEGPMKGTYFYAYGEAGFSLHYITGSELIIGAPGVREWQGTIASYENSYSGKTLKVLDRYNRNNRMPFEEKYTYFGYSVSSGIFLESNRNKRWYLSSAPRGSNLKGEVYIYDVIDNYMDVLYKLSGSEMGEYFGYSLAVTDINQDGIDEIIVGAPIYSYGNTKTDSGRVYLFTSDGKGGFEEGKILNQFSEKNARIGTAVSAVGDINIDGYNDVVIGAPYGHSRRGFVLICYGFNNGLNCEKPIYSTSINTQLRGFGMSISRGVDIDDNDINDFAVGSALSGHVVVFKSRSKLHVTSRFFSTPSEFSIKTNRITLTTCLTYSGRNVPRYMDLRRSIKFTDDRVDFNDHISNLKNKFQKDVEHCVDVILNVHNDHSDLIKPLTIILTYGTESKDVSGCDPYYQKIESLNIDYVIGCEDEDNCRSDLIVSGEYNWTKPSLVIGESNNIQLFGYVENVGDPAFNCRLYVTLPEYVGFHKLPDMCTDFNGTNNEYCFNVGKIMNRNEKKKVVLHLMLDVDNIPIIDKLIIKLNASSNSRDRNKLNNVKDAVLPLGIDEVIEFTSNSIPDSLSSASDSKSLTFTTKINNLGPSPLDHLKIEFFIPVTVNKIKILKLQHLNAEILFFKSDKKEILDCVDEGISLLTFYLNPKINETSDETHLYITQNTEDINVDYRKYSCSINKRFLIHDQIHIKLPANVEIEKFRKLDKSKTVFYLNTYAIVYKSGGETEENVIVTKIIMISESYFYAWIGAGIAIGLICFIIIAVILIRLGFFKRKMVSKAKILRKEDFEEVDM